MHRTDPATYHPDWVPASGHRLHLTGVCFDAVRIHGVRGEVTTAELIAAAGTDEVGPVVCEAGGFRWMYFLLPPGTAIGHQWPRDVEHFGGGRRTVAYVGIPALTGNTWPLRWHSRPTREAPFVEPKQLHEVTTRLAGCRLVIPARPHGGDGR